MSIATASILSTAVLVYLTVGAVYALVAQFRGIDPADSDVRNGSWGFRLAITPGLIGLWPVLLVRGLGVGTPNTPHDRACR